MKYLVLIFLIMSSVCTSFAQSEVASDTTKESLDTVYFYRNWSSVFQHEPFKAYSGPIVYTNNALEVQIYTNEQNSQNDASWNSIICNIGDTLWMINSNYIDKNFKCSYDGFSNYMPLFFNSKVAIIQYWNDYPENAFSRMMPYGTGEKMQFVPVHLGQPTLYYIDFIHKRIIPLDHKVLASLMSCYPDLQSRYLAMKKNSKSDVFDFFLQKYMERVEQDEDAYTIMEQLQLNTK